MAPRPGPVSADALLGGRVAQSRSGSIFPMSGLCTGKAWRRPRFALPLRCSTRPAFRTPGHLPIRIRNAGRCRTGFSSHVRRILHARIRPRRSTLMGRLHPITCLPTAGPQNLLFCRPDYPPCRRPAGHPGSTPPLPNAVERPPSGVVMDPNGVRCPSIQSRGKVEAGDGRVCTHPLTLAHSHVPRDIRNRANRGGPVCSTGANFLQAVPGTATV